MRRTAPAWAGMKLGERWRDDPRLEAAFHRFDAAIVAIGLIAVAWFVVHRVRRARRG